jgi:hypothetical protein
MYSSSNFILMAILNNVSFQSFYVVISEIAVVGFLVVHSEVDIRSLLIVVVVFPFNLRQRPTPIQNY